MMKKLGSYLRCFLIINLLPNFFYSSFIKQCSPNPSNNVLPAKNIIYIKKDRIQTLCFGKSDVTKLIKALDVTKTHGHDGISVKMIKICADSLVAGIFTKYWKNSKHCSNSLKNDKQIASNYRPDMY